MMTITISTRAVVLAALMALAVLSALYATEATGSGSNPDSILQGDTDCDGDVDAQDALNDLRYVGGLQVGPFGACPEIGTEAAIPGPPGPQGPQGEQGPPGVNLWAAVSLEGELLSGTAISASRRGMSTGSYTVMFGQDLADCALLVTANRRPGGLGSTTHVVGQTYHGLSAVDPGEVWVDIYVDQGFRSDESFSLVAVC